MISSRYEKREAHHHRFPLGFLARQLDSNVSVAASFV
jgi:hypothetical protein